MQVGSSFLISFVLAVAALVLTVAGVPVAPEPEPEQPRAILEAGVVRPVASLQATPVTRSAPDHGSGFPGSAAGLAVSGDLAKTAADR